MTKQISIFFWQEIIHTFQGEWDHLVTLSSKAREDRRAQFICIWEVQQVFFNNHLARSMHHHDGSLHHHDGSLSSQNSLTKQHKCTFIIYIISPTFFEKKENFVVEWEYVTYMPRNQNQAKATPTKLENPIQDLLWIQFSLIYFMYGHNDCTFEMFAQMN